MKTYDSLDDTAKCGSFVYCLQHRRVHNTGWCSVPNLEKVALISENIDDAVAEWELKAPKLFVDFSEHSS